MSPPIANCCGDLRAWRAFQRATCLAWSYDENGETQFVTVMEMPPVDYPGGGGSGGECSEGESSLIDLSNEI